MRSRYQQVGTGQGHYADLACASPVLLPLPDALHLEHVQQVLRRLRVDDANDDASRGALFARTWDIATTNRVDGFIGQLDNRRSGDQELLPTRGRCHSSSRRPLAFRPVAGREVEDYYLMVGLNLLATSGRTLQSRRSIG